MMRAATRRTFTLGTATALATSALLVVPAPSQAADTTPPNTAISGGVAQGSVTTATSARVYFTATEPASFTCTLDGAPWTACTSPWSRTGLARGVHTLAVRATDAAGNADRTPAVRTWTVVAATPGTDKPTAWNTGVPQGVRLTRYDGDLVARTAGATYDSLDIHGFVKIEASDVTIRRSIIRGGVATRAVGLIIDTNSAATGFVVEDSTLIPQYPSVYEDGVKGRNYTLLRVEISGTVDGAKAYGDNVRIESSWIHDMTSYDYDPTINDHTHTDGVEVQGGKTIRILGNAIYGVYNSALQVTQDVATTSDLEFVKNWADGGGCTVNLNNKPLGSMTGITVSYNRFGHTTRLPGCAVIASRATTVTAVGNVWDDTGLPVSVRPG